MVWASLLRSSVFRLTLVATLVLGLVAGGAIYLVGRDANARLTLATERAIARDIGELRRTLETGGFEALAAAVDVRSRLDVGGLYWLSDAAGARRSGNLLARPQSLDARHRAGIFRYRPTGGTDDRRHTAAGVLIGIEGGGDLVVARDIEDQRALLSAINLDLALSLGGLAFLGIVGGLALARHILGRIEAMSAASEAIMTGNLSERIPRLGTGDELDRLADRLNAMLERIERLMTGLREVSENIAHDLKTPLNRLRLRAEQALADQRGSGAWREGLERTIEEADDLIKTFNALLLIARLEAGALEDTLEVVDLAEIVRDVAELYEPVAEDAGMRLVVGVCTQAPVRANRQLVGQALANLIDNAIKYGRAREAGQTSDPTVVVEVASREGHALLQVADRGPGIGDADRSRALQRFVRLDPSRTTSGTGLGLSLVAAVAHLHRGSLRLEDNAPGLRVVLSFPRATTASGIDTLPSETPNKVEA
jgi:signal transduction histidine kinase